MPKHFISFNDLSHEELSYILGRASFLKAERAGGCYLRDHLKGRSVAMIFNKNSTRTRISFECAINELGGHPVVLSEGQTQMSRGEPIDHTANVFSRYLAGVVIRTFAQSTLTDLAKYGTIPVVNALTDEGHPCQILTDILTIIEKFPTTPLEKIPVAWVGDGNNMANSWLEAAAVFGFPLALACPEGYDPDKDILNKAVSANPKIKLVRTPDEAAKGAWAVNTDVWASMGMEAEAKARMAAFKDFIVDSRLMGLADSKAIFLHCLPAHIGEEVSQEVLDSPASVIFDQAENRLHAQKALLEFLIAG